MIVEQLMHSLNNHGTHDVIQIVMAGLAPYSQLVNEAYCNSMHTSKAFSSLMKSMVMWKCTSLGHCFWAPFGGMREKQNNLLA